MAIGVFLTPAGIGGGRSTTGRNVDHDTLSPAGEEGCDKDKENIVKEGNDQEGGGNAYIIDFDGGEEGDAHAGAHDILRDPEEGIVFGMSLE